MGKKENLKRYGKYLITAYVLMYLIFFAGYRHQLEKENILIVSLYFIAGLIVIIALLLWEEKKKVLFPPYVGIYGIFILSYITSVIHSVNIGESGYELILTIAGLCIFIVILNAVKLGWEKEIINGALIVGLIYIGNKIYQLVARYIYFGEIDRCQRYILVGAPNKTAGLVGILLVFALAIFYNRKTTKEKIIPGALLAGSLIVMFFTGSRGGLIAVGIGALIVILINYIHGNIHNLFTPPALILLVFIVSFPFLTTSIIKPIDCVGIWGTSITTRYDLWESALEIFTEYPVLGAGPGTWKMLLAGSFDIFFQHPHNNYLMILAERGLVGILTLAMLALTVIKTLLLDTKHIGLKAGGLAVIVVSAIHGLVDVPLLQPPAMRYLIIIIALAVANASIKGENKNAEINK